MSYDFALEKICSHEVMFERASVASDTPDIIRFARNPINQRVSLFIDGYEVPRSGLFSVPEIPFARPEPYRIIAGHSDLLYIGIPGSAPRMLALPTGGAVPAMDIARELSKQLPDLSVTVENHRVVIRGRTPGMLAAFSFPDPTWTDKTISLPSTSRILGAFKALGIVPGRVATGTQIYPGWNLIPDTTSPLDNAKAISFTSPLKNATPVIHLSYFTSAPDCRRCGGSQIEFDYNVVNGQYEVVTGADLLSQEFDKFLFTRSGSHFKWPWLGSKLGDRIGSKNVANGFTASSLITMDISQAFRTYQNIKIQQDQGYPFQQVSDAELPLALGDISVQQDPNDQTVAVVQVSINTRSREPIQLKRLVGTPNPFLLPGDNVPFRFRA